jgi:hypothetical protein
MNKSAFALIGVRPLKRLFFAATVMACVSAAYAAAVINPADVDEGVWRSIAITIGLFAAIQCHEHKDLIILGRVTESIEGICKWLFRVAIVLLVVPILGRFAGWHLAEMHSPGWTLFSVWSVLRAAQALYVSGISYGVSESSEISKRMNASKTFD